MAGLSVPEVRISRVSDIVAKLISDKVLKVGPNGSLQRNMPPGTTCHVALYKDVVLDDIDGFVDQYVATSIDSRVKIFDTISGCIKFLGKSLFKDLGYAPSLYRVEGNHKEQVSKYVSFSFFGRNPAGYSPIDVGYNEQRVIKESMENNNLSHMGRIRKLWTIFENKLNSMYRDEMPTISVDGYKFETSSERAAYCVQEAERIRELIYAQAAKDEYGVEVMTDEELLKAIEREKLKLTLLSETKRKVEEILPYETPKVVQKSQEKYRFYEDHLLGKYSQFCREAQDRELPIE